MGRASVGGGMLRIGRRGCLDGPGLELAPVAETCLCTNLLRLEKLVVICGWLGKADSACDLLAELVVVGRDCVVGRVGTGSGNGYGLMIGSS